ncbi:MAG: replication initiation protein [Candidatus Adiutrix sp.]|jgi:penicillin-insensitive murein endopeptidase|nr:replication initiation protein [Candidatus Adiutrix sp.]
MNKNTIANADASPRKKSALRTLGRAALGFVALIAFAALALSAKPLFSESLDLKKYIVAKADAYQALPVSGPNFKAASRFAHGLGRYYLRGRTAAAIVAAYAELARTHPDYHYVYGEMGWKGGGRFRPHRTHRQGLSADFMTPMLKTGRDGKAVPARPFYNALNLWGYRIRLDGQGRYKNYQLDAKAMIAHLAALKKTAPRFGLRVERVIFDPPLLKLLRADPSFAQLRGLAFMKNQAWFPHDGHYHVDFAR